MKQYLFAKKFLTICLGFCIPAYATEGKSVTYKIKRGETVGHVLQALGKCPLYGKNGQIKQVIRMNAETVLENGNFVLTSQDITLQNVEAQEEWTITSDKSLVFLGSLKEIAKGKCNGDHKNVSDERNEVININTPKNAEPMPPEKSQPPSSEPVLTEKKKVFTIYADLFESSIDADDIQNDQKAELRSGLSYGLGLRLDKSFNENLGAYFGYELDHIKYDRPSNRSLKGGTQNLNALFLGSIINVSSFKLALEMSASERSLLRALSLTAIELEKIPVLEFAMIPDLEVFQSEYGNIRIQGRAGFSPNATSSHSNAEAGLNSYGGKIYLCSRVREANISAGIFGKYYILKNTEIEQSTLEKGLEFRSLFEF